MNIENRVLLEVNEDDIVNGLFEVPDYVTEIGEYAFFDCRELKEVKMPKGVTKIAEDAFNGCSKLEKISIPESVTKIGWGAFKDCRSINEIKIPENVTEIDPCAFEGCVGLTEVNIPENITVIRQKVFKDCRNLKKIKISEGVTKIDAEAFANCNELTEINIPENIIKLEDSVFSGCINLKKIKIPESITEIGNYVFEGCSGLTEIKLPENLTRIKDGAFIGCRSLKEIKIPEGVTSIGSAAFLRCSSLEKVKIPKSVSYIKNETFAECKGLLKIEIPESVVEINRWVFDKCENLKEVKIPEGVTMILDGAFNDCKALTKINIPESVTEIREAVFKNCRGLKEIKIPESVTKIERRAFEKCSNLTEINIHEGITEIGKFAFADCSSLKELKIPHSVEHIGESFLRGVNYNSMNYDESNIYFQIKNEIKNDNKYIPSSYFLKLKENGNLLDFLKNANFKNFNSNIPNLSKLLEDMPEEEKLDFFKFAVCLGCFSNEKMLNKDGQETETTVGQKASSLLAQLIKTDGLKIGRYHGLFDSMPIDVRVPQDFISFLSPQGKIFEKLQLLIGLEQKYPGIFVKAMSDFGGVKEKRVALNEDGTTKTVSWEDALIKQYYANEYKGVTDGCQDIAEIFSRKGINQNVFDEAVKLRNKAKSSGISEHILNKPLKEKPMLQQIEEIQSATEEQFKSSRELIDEVYKRKFSYEWLSKNDPKNGIMGLYASCCGSLNSAFYGRDIAESSIIAKDVQNLIVRDFKGDIIAKGTVYVNEEEGYGVFNDFEINSEYKKDEKSKGIYYGDDKEESELNEAEKNNRNNRNMIFDALKRGMEAFIEEYDEQHPDNPIKQVNVGMGYNRLKRNVMEYEKASENLSVPSEYSFKDAEFEQYVLYARDVEEKNKNVEEIENNL